MSIFHYLIVFGIPAAVLFVIFRNGARKVGKDATTWGAIGALVYIGAMVILGPILIDKSRDAIGNSSSSLFFSYSAIAFLVSIGAAAAVYKFVLSKPKP